ncbi:hypothetical protein AC578_9749 [Pseudocercospora eumusae]|uniref:Uncharacterized protein n=1 Tax=Pseudocercospora eumusae TaxID=321146 RepID=A0A139HQL8_9PEZI|nr:hypothetical protein AC578_9749 [Pseudocercospora eumusae]
MAQDNNFDEFARTIQQDATDIELEAWQQHDQVMTDVSGVIHNHDAEPSSNAEIPTTNTHSISPARQQLALGQRPPQGQEVSFENRSLLADMAPTPPRQAALQTTYPVDTTPLPSPVPPRPGPPPVQNTPLANHDQSQYGWTFADQAPTTQQESLPAPSVKPQQILDPTEIALLRAFSQPIPHTQNPAQPSPAESVKATNAINGTWNISVRIVLQELRKYPQFSDSVESAKVLKRIWPERFPDAMTDGNFSKTIAKISVEWVNVEGKRWELKDLIGEDHEWRVQVREILRRMGVV